MNRPLLSTSQLRGRIIQLEARVEELEAEKRELCDEAQQIVSMALSGRDSRPDGRSVVSDESLDRARAVLRSVRKAGS